MSMSAKTPKMHYPTMVQADVPQGRNGKHKGVVSVILQDLNQLQEGAAIKIPLETLAEGKEQVRSALNRATRKAGIKVQTASDDQFLYVWNDVR